MGGATTMRGRCDKHDVALAPDGRCIVCTRPSQPPPPKAPARGFLSGIVTAVLIAGLLGSVAALAVLRLRPEQLGAATEPEARARGLVPEPIALEKAPRRVADPSLVKAQARAQAEARVKDKAPAADPQPSPAEDEARMAAARAEEAQRDRERSATIAAELRDREARVARERVGVIMYSTQWCGACASARAFLARENIAFVEYDVDADPDARQRQRELNPAGGVPTFDIEGRVLVGFSDRAILAAIDGAARGR